MEKIQKVHEQIDKEMIRNLFSEIIDESQKNIEAKTQIIMSILSSMKEENEQIIKKSNSFLNFFILNFFNFSQYIL